MIEPNELRLGNLVLYCDEVQEVTAIRRYEYNLTNTEGNIATVDVEPIVLSTSILEKCGFESGSYHTNDFYHPDLNLHLHYYEGDGNCEMQSTDDIVVSEPFKHLHILQNIFFSLTQTELKIDL